MVKKSTRKRRPNPLLKRIKESEAQRIEDRQILVSYIDDIWSKIHKIERVLNYNQIFPERKNRWIPSINKDK